MHSLAAMVKAFQILQMSIELTPRPYELKKLIMLLRRRSSEDDDADKDSASAVSSSFPLRSHVIHVMSSMAKNDGFDVCRQYFDIGRRDKGLSVPNIRDWQPGPVSGFSFHCWIRLDNPRGVADRGGKEERRQLYRDEQQNSLFDSSCLKN